MGNVELDQAVRQLDLGRRNYHVTGRVPEPERSALPCRRGQGAQNDGGTCGMRVLFLILALLWSLSLHAVQPDEMLADPVLEARAQALDHELRCVLCRSESIASSNADWASDARIIVRELLRDGASDAEVMDFFVARYGDFVLMKPRISGANIALWLAGPLILLAALLALILRARARRSVTQPAPLSAEEQDALARLVQD